MEDKDLHILINECKKGIPKSQRALFDYMYDFGMTVASRYGNTLAESEDIANEGFYKVLKNISSYKSSTPFLAWTRRVIINCAIDQYRKKKNSEGEVIPLNTSAQNNGSTSMDSEYLLRMVRSLSPQYKMVFVLHAIEGYSHDEIAKKLNISKGSSKSNLSKARKKLQQMVNLYNEKNENVRS